MRVNISNKIIPIEVETINSNSRGFSYKAGVSAFL